ncbi:MAG: hypothetical protein SV765_00295 [Pseudomonadota bacterium]|nr:hypothetical protein [Pseudomonadota bacterium]
MNAFENHWNELFRQDDKQSIDVISSVTEDGVNFLLARSHEIDATLPTKERKYSQTFERTFDTFDDPRKFKMTLTIVKPLKFKLPPFTSGHLSSGFESSSGWNEYQHSASSGAEIKATSIADDTNLVEMSAPEVTVKLEWDKLDGTGTHTWEIPPFEVLGLIELELHKDEGYYIKLVPKMIKLNIERGTVRDLAIESASSATVEDSDCEEKFVDLFIIAANIAAYEQTPKLVMSIDLPALTITDRPVLPAAFEISDNIMSLGFGLDRTALSSQNKEVFDQQNAQLKMALESDIAASGGLQSISRLNAEEQDGAFPNTDEFILKQQHYLKAFEEEDSEKLDLTGVQLTQQDSFAVAINEYFLDTIARSAAPEPKYDCSKEERVLDAIKGNVCNWTTINNPDINIKKVGNDAKLEASAFIDIGGKIRGCVRKFWDCSWRWSCSSLALTLIGRPKLSVRVLKANGVRVLANVDPDNLRVKSNIAWPFNKIVDFFASWVVRGIIGVINILAALLSFYVIKPEFDLESLHMRLMLRNFDSFYFEKTQAPSTDSTKNKFMCFKTKLSATKLP